MNDESLQLLPEGLGECRTGGGEWQSKSERSGVVLSLLTVCLLRHTEPCKSRRRGVL